MRKLIKQWVLSKKPIVILGNERIESIFTYEYYEFMGMDEKFYRCDFIFNNYKILGTWGTISRGNNLFIEGTKISDVKNNDLFRVLDSYLKMYDTKEEWSKNNSLYVSKDDLDNLVARHLEELTQNMYNITSSNFSVDEVNVRGDYLVVNYRYLGNIQIPIKINIWEPSPVKKIDYGEHTKEFISFVYSISESVLWY